MDRRARREQQAPAMRSAALLVVALVALASAETYYTKSQPFDRAGAIEGVYRTLAALDQIKRIGHCGDAALLASGMAALNATLSKDFQYYNLSTTGGASPFVLQVDRAGYLGFMQIIASSAAYYGSQHAAVDPLVSFSRNGETAYITGRFIEFGTFFDSNGIPLAEESQSDFSAVVALEDVSEVHGWPSFSPLIDKMTDHPVVPETAFRVVRLYEQGNMRKSNGIVRDYQRKMCPGTPDATNCL